ncbi:ArsC/Spx/MgsR family protein [Arcobacter sp. s6]|uniref:ArsC/Spx/MgsR family protein n=1 Tax=Arcobacter sp. s6 TaxID=3230363 RepID=UPI00349FDE30
MADFVFYNFIFYEKIGCNGNAKQKEVLKSHNISFTVKSLLDEKWTFETLSEYFKGLEVKDIFNPFAPQIKNEEINILSIKKDEAINLMIKEPILIKRPLLDINGIKLCGFNIEQINKLLNVNIDTNKKLNTCSSSDSCTNA